MNISISDLINSGSYWSKIAQIEHRDGVLDLCKLRPVTTLLSSKLSTKTRKKPSLEQLDRDMSVVGR